jgi:outer membrane protein OmpA-like peptidoglycan-associated protein
MSIRKLSLLVLSFAFVVTGAFAQGRLNRAKTMMQELDFQGAITLYNQILETEDNSEAKINIAECYRKIGDAENSEYWYGQVVRLAEAQPIHQLYYAMMLQRNGKCDLAKEWYEKYAAAVPDDVRGQYLSRACDYEEELKTKNASLYELKRADINSNLDDFGAAFYKGGIVFASERDLGSAVKRQHDWTGYPFLELYFVETKMQGEEVLYGRAEKFSNALNSKFHDATLTFSKDQSQVFFTRNNYLKGKAGKSDEGIIKLKVYSSKSNGDDSWGSEESLPFNSDEYSVAHPTLSPEGNKLYFSSDMPGGFGGMDLYVSELESGRWGPPMNLGPKINTEGNELFPNYHKSQRLYFASDGLMGLGGLDIFYVDDKGNNDWGEPENLGYPINTDDDDFSLILNEEGNFGFLSSDRDGGAGRDDLYSFRKLAVPIEVYVFDADTKEPIEGATVVESCTNRSLTTDAKGRIRLDQKIKTCCDFTASMDKYSDNKKEGCTLDFSSPDMVVVEIPLKRKLKFDLEGIVFDLSSGMPLENAKVTLISDCPDQQPQMLITDASGKFHYDLRDDCCYKLKAEKDEYFAVTSEDQCPKDETESKTFRVTLNLQPTSTTGSGNPGDNTNSLVGMQRDPNTGLYMDPKTGKPADGTYGNVTFKNGEITDKPTTGTVPFEPSAAPPDAQGRIPYILHVYYDFDQAFIRDEAMEELGKLYKLLTDNPSYIIEISSHTDSRGSNSYNDRLSQRRAESVVRWLVSKGVERDRLVPIGYGESLNVNDCANNVPCAEQKHQMNRRTEFKVLGCKGCVKDAPLSYPNENAKVDPCVGCPF